MAIGRPPKYKSVKSLQKAIDAYFDKPPTIEIETTAGVALMPNISVTGLALHLGFSSRLALNKYEAKPEFVYPIKRAKLYIESQYEFRLQVGKNVAGAIFALKNFGWSDKAEVEVTTNEPRKVVYHVVGEDGNERPIDK